MNSKNVKLINAWLAYTRATRELNEAMQSGSDGAIFIKKKLYEVALREYTELFWQHNADALLKVYFTMYPWSEALDHELCNGKKMDCISTPHFRKFAEEQVKIRHAIDNTRSRCLDDYNIEHSYDKMVEYATE